VVVGCCFRGIRFLSIRGDPGTSQTFNRQAFVSLYHFWDPPGFQHRN